MSLTLPRAGITPGRTADTRTAMPDFGEPISQLGETMNRIGVALEADGRNRQYQRAELQMLERFNTLELDLTQLGDPDAMDTQFRNQAPSVLGAGPRPDVPLIDDIRAQLPAQLQERFDQRYSELQLGTARSVGRSALEARRSERLAFADQAFTVTSNAAADAPSDEGRDANADQMAGLIAGMVTDGVLTPEQANAQLTRWERGVAAGRATRLLQGNPDELLTALDGPDFSSFTPEAREGWRSRAAARVSAMQTETITAFDRAAADATRVLLSGRDYAGTEDLLANPLLSQTEPGRAFARAALLHRQLPGIASLPIAEQEQMLAARRTRSVQPGATDELDLTRALGEFVTAQRAAWARDPLGQAAAVGIIQLTALPNPTSASPEDIAAAIATRVGQSNALQSSAHIADPALMRPDEQSAWQAATGLSAAPDDRVRLAGALASGLGTDAPRLIAQFSDDPVFGFVGGMIAATNNTALARQIFEGQRAIANHDVPLPSEPARRQVWFQNFGGLFDNFSESGLRDQVIGATDALAATRLRGDPNATDDSTRQSVWMQAAHETMGGIGQYNSPSARGGVQVLRGIPTIMPDDVRAADVEQRLRVMQTAMVLQSRPGQPDNALRETWASFSPDGQVPMIGGEMLDRTTLRNLTFQAGPDDSYWAQYIHPATGQPLLLTDETGAPYRINLRRLLEWQP